MVWYIPPLSPVVDAVSRDGHDGEESATCSGRWRRCASHPVSGRVVHRRRHHGGGGVLRRLAAMRSYMRDINLAAKHSRIFRRRSG